MSVAPGNVDRAGQITDMSQTINAPPSGTNSEAGSQVQAAMAQQPTTSQSRSQIQGEAGGYQRAVENRFQSVQSEMSDIRKAIGDLSKAVTQLSQIALNQGRGENTPVSTPAMAPGHPLNSERAGDKPTEQNTVPEAPEIQRRENNVIRINKLGLMFDGTTNGLAVEEFVYRLEYFQWQYRIPWAEVIRDFPLLMTGRAESWYWLFQKTHRFHNWDDLKHSLLSQYQSSRSNFEILTDLAQRKQDMNESIDTFFHVMGQIRAKLVQPISEFDMIKIMKKNVRESIGRIVYPIQVSSVEQLRMECNEAEKNFPRRDNRNVQPSMRPTRHVNDIYMDITETGSEDDYDEPRVQEVAAVHYERNSRAPMTCWNCRQQGHSFRDCEEAVRTLFCYKCGNPGTTTPRYITKRVLTSNKKIVRPDTRHYVPIEIRQENYDRVRERIFGESDNKDETIKIIPKVRQKFKKKRKEMKILLEAICRASDQSDPRVYAEVKLQDINVRGLLDTGASVSILGKGCRELMDKLEMSFRPIFSQAKTAGGQVHTILGKVQLGIQYKDQIKGMDFYLCPDLEQQLYLGIDFWRLFGLAPDIIDVNECNIEKIVKDMVDEDEKYKLNPHELTPIQLEKLQKAIQSFDTFEDKGLGKTHLERHTITLVDGAVPVKDRHYPISPAVQAIVYEEIDNMLRLGVIEESESPWSNRTTVVRKPGKNRFCLDARKLNKLTVKDAYPLQNIDGILSRIDETYYISSVDLKFAFWQIELDAESKAYTAFTVPGRPLYQFRVMPFGLCNAAQRLCRLMDRVVPQHLKENVFIYLDDLLVISSDFDEHIRLLEEVAKCLRDANLTIGLKKSQFCFRELKYLGFIIGDGKLKTDPDKIKAIREIKVPRNPREVRSFLGTAGWYRRFIKDFASISAPLTDTLKKAKKFGMTNEAIQSFEGLKRALTSAPVLRHADFSKRFFIQCDASEYGIGAVLFQLNDRGEEHPIAFYSQKMNTCQRNYSVTEKECLAAVMAIKSSGHTWR
ncbi:uncharacterized protein LOC131995628 [Stomoxys calcitrans]|uniref:uncharacterized protein LOC131995628 n=1 Tax=Stomoxys calcitrans TaxID=35570 RepID=UPI0027E35D18|nr:uncharacterized protein LOC131995628 [Stomoxys calcitrans]